MMAIRIEKPRCLRLAEVPEPTPPAGWARVRVRVAAICATDFEVLRGTIAAAYPVTPGHEWSGEVEAVGASGDDAWLGRRVTGDNEITCRLCRYCRRGQWRRCPEYRQIGFAAPGAYAEKLLVPVANLYHLPDAVSFEQGALLEPLGVGLAVARMAGAHIGSTAAVLGCGPIGLNVLAALVASGARRVLCLDRRAYRLKLARRWGAFRVAREAAELDNLARELHPHGTDAVVDATGDPDMLRFGAQLARFDGAFVLAGYAGGCETSFRPDVVHERNVRVLGAENNSGFVETAMLAAGDGIVETTEMITHRFRLDQYPTAFAEDTLAAEDYVKAVFTS
jgi:threonine dehydrogenase-like Zn-dependent dehydrogenase